MNYKKLNLGCGNDFKEGFVNIDILDKPKCPYDFQRMDITVLPLGIADKSTNYILSSHILEHLFIDPNNPEESTKAYLKDWRRILIQGGVLELMVPDFDDIIKRYEAEMIVLQAGGQTILETGRSLLFYLKQQIYGGSARKGNQHRYGFSFKDITQWIEDVGFKILKSGQYCRADYEPQIHIMTKKL